MKGKTIKVLLLFVLVVLSVEKGHVAFLVACPCLVESHFDSDAGKPPFYTIPEVFLPQALPKTVT